MSIDLGQSSKEEADPKLEDKIMNFWFSHNPSDGSFTPLAIQPNTWTKRLNLRFLQ